GEAYALGARDHRADQPCRLELQLALAAIEQAAIELRLGRRDDVRRGMPEDHRTQRHVVVDQAIAVDVMEIDAVGALEDQGRRRYPGAEMTADAAGNLARGFGNALLGARERT